ncbi:MAG: diguanylate cyclase [Lachnospiraceae bacterium]|nr:diguanylate cyclase [Lachnospiraceae bacterium]
MIGNQFLEVPLKDKTGGERTIKRIFDALTGSYEGIPLSISMGVAKASVIGNEYTALFHAADQALYSAKRAGRRRYLFYDDSMRDMLSAVFPDGEEI